MNFIYPDTSKLLNFFVREFFKISPMTIIADHLSRFFSTFFTNFRSELHQNDKLSGILSNIEKGISKSKTIIGFENIYLAGVINVISRCIGLIRPTLELDGLDFYIPQTYGAFPEGPVSNNELRPSNTKNDISEKSKSIPQKILCCIRDLFIDPTELKITKIEERIIPKYISQKYGENSVKDIRNYNTSDIRHNEIKITFELLKNLNMSRKWFYSSCVVKTDGEVIEYDENEIM